MGVSQAKKTLEVPPLLVFSWIETWSLPFMRMTASKFVRKEGVFSISKRDILALNMLMRLFGS